MQKRILVLLFSGLVASMCALGASSDSSEWTISATGSGTYSYAGGTAALVGSDIMVNSAIGELSGAANTQSYTILNNVGGGSLVAGGVLDFSSGAFDTTTAGTWTWDGGGDLTLQGCLSLDGSTCIAGETGTTDLLLDSFTSVSIENVGSGIQEAVFGGVTGTVDPAAATALEVSTTFGLPASPNDAISDVVSGLPSTLLSSGPTAFTATQAQGTLDLGSVAVAEEWSLFSTLGIFAFGSVVFGVARRRGLIKPVAF
jgi:hypothetical protein